MTLIMMNNAEAGPSRPKALWDPVPRVNAMYDFDFIEVPSSPEVDVEHAFDTPVATTATTVEEAQSTQSSSSSFRGPAKRKKRSNVEVVIPLRRKKIRRILSPTPESDTTASPTPPARPRPSVPRARLIPPIPPPLPAPEVSLPPYLLSADPVQPSIHYTRPTTGPLGLGPAPLPPRAPGPRCTAQSWALVKLGISADRHPEAVFIPNGTDTPSDIWSSSSIFRVSHLKYEPADVALRAWLLGKGPRVDSDQVKGKGKGGKVKDKGKMVSVELAKVDTPVLAAAEASAARKEEEERNGRSASQALDIAESDDGNEVEVEVEIPHSQTMPIEHPPTPARGSPTPTTDLAGDVDDDDYRPKQEVAPMQLLTGDQRFRIGKPIVAWPAHVLAKKARIVKAAEAKVKAEAEAAAAAQAAQAPLQPEGIFPEGSTSKLDNGDEIKPHDKDSEPDIITRVTRSMLAPPPPPADAQDAQEAVRSAALRVAYREHGRTIGADVWHTIMECEAKEEEWAREEKAAEETKAEV